MDFLIKVNSIAVVVIFISSCKGTIRFWIKGKITKQKEFWQRATISLKGKVEKFKHFCRKLFECFIFAIAYIIFLLFDYAQCL